MDRPALDGEIAPKEVEITPEMIEAGVNQLWDLQDQVKSASLVT
jgi:hypothetical protein